MTAPPLGPAIQLLDAGRSRLYLALRPIAPSWLAERDRRIAAVGALLLGLAFVTATSAPILLLALGPVVWGVPHLVADIRYLVARPGFARAPALYASGAVVAILSVMGFGARAGLAGAAAAALLSRGALARRACVLALASGLFAIAHQYPEGANIAFVHAHNLVAFAYFIAWRRPGSANRGRTRWVPVGLTGVFLLASSWILLGPMSAPLFSGGLSGLDLEGFASFLAPANSGDMGLRLVVFFAFAQAAHYVVWLHLLPQHISATPRPLSFSQSYRSLTKDVGAPVIWVAAAAFVVVAATALRSLHVAREVYLGIAFFHAHLELIAAALLLSAPRSARA